MLDIRANNRDLWFHTVDGVTGLLNKVGVLVHHTSLEATGITGLSGITIYGKFRE